MLSPISVRICRLAVMAPALTEAAATQGDNFNSPPFSNIRNTQINGVRGGEDTSCILDSDSSAGSMKKLDCVLLNKKLLWNTQILQKLTNGKNLNQRSAVENGEKLAIWGDGLKRDINLLQNTMTNKPVTSTKDSMGLLNTNSVNCGLKENNDSPSVGATLATQRTNETTNTDVPVNRVASPVSKPSSSASSIVNRTNQLENLGGTQHRLERKANFLLKRLRRLQFHQVENHVVQQLRTCVDYEQKALQIPCQRQLPSDLKAELLKTEDVKNLSTAALVNLVKKLEHSQTRLSANQRIASLDAHFDRNAVPLKLNAADSSEIGEVSVHFLNTIQHLQKSVDSDATESSSGGESADEFDGYNEKKGHKVPIHKRALWNWAYNRAAIASRWTWLQTQIADLEFRIRQQTETYKKIRLTKEVVTLGEEASSSSFMSHLSSALSGNVKSSSKVVNGYVESSGGPAAMHSDVAGVLSDSLNASRTRPLKSFRQRRLLRTELLGSHWARKNIKTSVKCTCSSDMSCILCCDSHSSVGNFNSFNRPLSERISYLDSSFHPILSFEKDYPLTLHLENLLNCEEYRKPANLATINRKRPKLTIPVVTEQARKHSQKLTKNAAQSLLSSAKMRKRYADKKKNKKNSRVKNMKRRKRTMDDIDYVPYTKRDRIRRHSVSALSSGSSMPSSPIPSPSPFDGNGRLLAEYRRRRTESAFDIDNIVIPYSVASSTRVEKIQYKEILTPKWRINEVPPLTREGGEPSNEEVEDTNDDAYIQRHKRCEINERKRFSTAGPPMTRMRSRRTDSCRTDDSCPDTPDLVMMDHDGNSCPSQSTTPVVSPPATPLSAVNSDDSQGASSSMTTRRRTPSLCKKEYSLDDIMEVDEIEPYDVRLFPLPDDVMEQMAKDSPHLLEPEMQVTEPPESTSPVQSAPESPASSGSNATIAEEDPNDPEWTVVTSEKPSLVLKLAKR